MPVESAATVAIHAGSPKQQREGGLVTKQLAVVGLPRQPAKPHDAPNLGPNEAVWGVPLEEVGDRFQLAKGLRTTG